MTSHSPRGLIVVTGPMFSGKTEELGRHYTRFHIAKKTIGLCKPHDHRTGSAIVSRSGFRAEGTLLNSAEGLLSFASAYDVVIIDEAQFFDESLPAVVRKIMRERLVIVFGLNLDFQGVPFTNMAMLMAMATEPVVYLTAVCGKCHSTRALYSQRLTSETDRIVTGFANYEPRCLTCFEPPTST